MWAQVGSIGNRAFFISLLLVALICTGQTSAAVFTWDGGGTTNNWNDAGNWPVTAPPSDGTADIVFAGALRLTPNVEAPYSILSLSFNNTAGAFNIGGTTLTVGAGGI